MCLELSSSNLLSSDGLLCSLKTEFATATPATRIYVFASIKF